MKKYNIIYADPPWSFNNKNTGGSMKSGSSAKYKTMTLEEMKRLNIDSISNENCVLFMWWVATQPVEALDLIESWGFKLKTMTGFTWIKLSESKIRTKFINKAINFIENVIPKSKILNYIIKGLEKLKFINDFGMGFWTRQSSENCLIAVKGKPKRINASVRNVIYAVNEEHSKKPSEARKRIVDLMSDIPRIELFARNKTEGWDVWGNEVDSDIII